jgi:FemAB-related protein (PEP-CTERM system-associated)
MEVMTSISDSAGEVVVSEYTEKDRSAWAGFVGMQAESTFFHNIEWRDVITEGLGHCPHYLMARQGEDVIGILPLAEVKSRLFGHRLVSTPACVYGGIVAQSRKATEALIKEAYRLTGELGVGSLEIRNRSELADAGYDEDFSPWRTKELYVTFRKKITGSDEENLRAIPRKQRAMVRKGIAAGLETELTGDVSRFYKVYAESVRNLGTPVFPLRYFHALTTYFGDRIEMAVVRHGGRDLAAVMSFYFRDEVLPYYAGSIPAARSLKANDFMYWDLMSRAARRGVRVFDYGRSKVGTGSYSFKKNWGFAPTQLYYQYRLVGSTPMPDLNPNSPRYQLFVALWKHLPLSIANTFGPMLARHLG